MLKIIHQTTTVVCLLPATVVVVAVGTTDRRGRGRPESRPRDRRAALQLRVREVSERVSQVNSLRETGEPAAARQRGRERGKAATAAQKRSAPPTSEEMAGVVNYYLCLFFDHRPERKRADRAAGLLASCGGQPASHCCYERENNPHTGRSISERERRARLDEEAPTK